MITNSEVKSGSIGIGNSHRTSETDPVCYHNQDLRDSRCRNSNRTAESRQLPPDDALQAQRCCAERSCQLQ